MRTLDSYRITVLALALLTAIMFAYPCVRVFAEFEIDYNEGWNAFLQTLAMAGESPYTAPGPLFLNNYPPLSFYLVGGLGVLLGDPVLAGRLLSALSVAVISACCGVVVRRAGGGRNDAMLASVTCLGIFCTYAIDYVGVDDPQLLAEAFLCVGFALYAGGRGTPGRMAVIAVLFSAGLLTKHNVLILPLVVTMHVLWRGPAASRWTYLGVGLALAGLSAALIHAVFGPAFFTALLAPRIYDVTRGFLLSQEVLGYLQTLLAVAGLFFALTRMTSVKVKVAAYLVGSLLLGMGFSGGAGVDYNIFFDAMIALSMSVGLAATWLRQQAHLPRLAPAALAVLANAGLLLLTPQTLGRMAVDALGDYREREMLFRQDVEWMKGIEGPVLCESMLLCHRAGKRLWVDPYNALQAMLTGRLPEDLLVDKLRRREIAVVEIKSVREHPVPESPGLLTAPQRFVNFADNVFDELDRSYELKRVGGAGRFYQPKPLP
ncbi:hypothetical protein CU669_13190 [Paramagnetospirillum kuznetsovii]|uniref:Uncharacterized protein n=1 Tax=Paramagnetospirillum kuznetsovii TaxID=2053833 RepID=A0A364NWK7_9PROT|nr:glycosyltransferase family 39 protein [Paramagnetospirillum kuznetsovii]RAU21479.1 hypothetical protein CU669_13190 [Paramagnetospirillum kuznetsovii]